MARGIILFALMVALASASAAQEGGEGLGTAPAGTETGGAQAASEPGFVERLANLRAEQMTELDGLLTQAARAHEQATTLQAAGQRASAQRAERIASAALGLAESIVRRERLRARLVRIAADRRQVAAGMERARAALQHARDARVATPPDPNAPDPTDENEGREGGLP